MLLVGGLSLSASTITVKKLNVLLKGNTTVTYDRSEVQKITFTTEDCETTYQCVDMGMTSDDGSPVLWLNQNLGALKETEVGDFYAWGETETKSTFGGETYKYSKDGSRTEFTKYTGEQETLEAEDDAATAVLGKGYRTPTQNEWKWLRENCTWTSEGDWSPTASKNVTGGYRVTSKTTGNSIFLPAAGMYGNEKLWNRGSAGFYWTSTHDVDTNVYIMYFNSSSASQSLTQGQSRYSGLAVRAVYSKVLPSLVDMGMTITNAAGEIKKLLWADRNVSATTENEVGDYFAWGETETKSKYDWSTYKWSKDGSEYEFTKYTDTSATLEVADDAATQVCGSAYRIPTSAEWKMLLDTTKYTWTAEGKWYTDTTEDYTTTGYRVTVKDGDCKGNSIFIPAAGYSDSKNEKDNAYRSSFGYYWSSNLLTSTPAQALSLYFSRSTLRSDGYTDRYRGQPIRAVSEQ